MNPTIRVRLLMLALSLCGCASAFKYADTVPCGTACALVEQAIASGHNPLVCSGRKSRPCDLVQQNVAFWPGHAVISPETPCSWCPSTNTVTVMGLMTAQGEHATLTPRRITTQSVVGNETLTCRDADEVLLAIILVECSETAGDYPTRLYTSPTSAHVGCTSGLAPRSISGLCVA